MSHVGPDAVPRGEDASELLHELVSHRLPAAVLREAHAAGARQAALYVIDIDGSCLIRLGGERSFPDRIQAPLAVGPELPPETFAQVQDIVSSKIPDARVTPLCVRDRALGVLVTCGGPPGGLQDLAAGAAVSLELVSGYTDAVHRARRRKDINAAGEIQQDLLPPRIATVAGAHVAGGVLPGYEVGGDFFDYAENDDGLWLAIGDAMGKGNSAAAISSLAVGALRAARRNDATLEQTAAAVHEAVSDVGGRHRFLTAVFAVWHPGSRTLASINCGHPPPLIVAPGGRAVTELVGEGTYPLGLFDRDRTFQRVERRIEPGQRVLLYSDGIAEHRSDAGEPFGTENIARALIGCGTATAAGTVRALQDAVLSFSRRPLRDDATILLMHALAEPRARASRRRAA
ncbi:MAG TPA: PP2C family protein-serine/threonine phosphatase [Solirubrobacteraceae bacterium]|nr:PP2C family protein-serine/threonine phosphatase [Solirubrobacteraceae bacterium]